MLYGKSADKNIDLIKDYDLVLSEEQNIDWAKMLRLVDEVAPAISICSDSNNKWIVTKSGNLGKSKTLIDILNYFKFHQE